jgi:hypothetical protein
MATAAGEIMKILGARDQRKNISKPIKSEKGGTNSWTNIPENIANSNQHISNGAIHNNVGVRAATTENIILSGLPTIDGVVCVEGDRILVKDQTDKKENGVYSVVESGWTRTSDLNENKDFISGMEFYVANGTINKKRIYNLTNIGSVTLGTTEIIFEQIVASPTKNRIFIPRYINAGYDDEFDDGVVDTDWGRIDIPTYEIEWHEPSNIKGMSAHIPPGVGSMKLRGLLKSFVSLEPPFYIETAVRIMSVEFGYPAIGLCFSDSSTYNSGNQVTGMYIENSCMINLSKWSTFNVRDASNEIGLSAGKQLDCIYMRLEYTAANTYNFYISMDGVAWINVNGSANYSVTPTHFGLITTTHENSTYPVLGQWLYFRVVSGTGGNG